MMERVRVASVGYLNAAPLTEDVDEARFEVVRDVPSRIADLLHRGEVDVALVPIAAVFDRPELRVVPGVCIGAEGRVDSVLLVAEVPPSQWTRVVLDGESRTSALLARLLLAEGPLAERVGDLEIVAGAPGCALEAARGTTASLVIGDAARGLPDRLTVRVDLAEQWSDWTGLPFVFAVWAGRADLPAGVVTHLREAARTGLAACKERYEGDDLRYLDMRIRYALDDRALIGLRRFAAMAHAAGLVASADIQLFGPAESSLPRVDLEGLLDRAVQGEVLTSQDVSLLADHARLLDLGAAAHVRRRALHPGDGVSWWPVVTLRVGEGFERVAAVPGAVRVHLDRGWKPAEVAALIQSCPAARVHVAADADALPALAAAGVVGLLADEAGMGVPTIRARVGAGSLDDRERAIGVARDLGLEVEESLAIGREETRSDRLEHVAWIARMDDRYGITAVRVWAAFLPGTPAASVENTAEDHLRWTALTRLALGGPSLRAAVSTEGLGMAQVSLRMGCDALGDVPLEAPGDDWLRRIERVEYHVHDAGLAPWREGDVQPRAGSLPGIRRRRPARPRA